MKPFYKDPMFWITLAGVLLFICGVNHVIWQHCKENGLSDATCFWMLK